MAGECGNDERSTLPCLVQDWRYSSELKWRLATASVSSGLVRLCWRVAGDQVEGVSSEVAERVQEETHLEEVGFLLGWGCLFSVYRMCSGYVLGVSIHACSQRSGDSPGKSPS